MQLRSSAGPSPGLLPVQLPAALLFSLVLPALVPAAPQKLPEPIARVELTAPGKLAVRGPAPIACGPDGVVYVVDRAGFRVLRFDPAGNPLAPIPYARRSPAPQPNLVSWIAVTGPIYLASSDAGFVLELFEKDRPASWLGLAAGGLPFLQIPARLAPGEKAGTMGIWDPGLKMVVTLGPTGEILETDRKVGLTPWPAPGGGHLFVTDAPDGSWRLKATRGTLDLPLPARAGGEKTGSCDIVGPMPDGGWVVHHYLGEEKQSTGACLRRIDAVGKLAAESVYALLPAEDLPPPPGSAVGPDGRVWFLSGTAENASLMVASP